MTRQNLVLGLVAENENQALEVAARSYFSMLHKAGYRYEVLDLYQTAGFERLAQALQSGEVAYVYGLAGVGSALPAATGENLWTATRTPFLSLWYDPPCYNYRQHCVDSPFVANLYHVRDHFEAAQNWLPQTRSSRRLLRPPCVINKAYRNKPFKERSQRILFAKTFQPLTYWTDAWAKQPHTLQDILHALAAAAQKNPHIDLCAEASHYFSQAGLDRNNLDVFLGVVQEVDGYVRAWRSEKLARALLPHPADIVGRGWDVLAGPEVRATLTGPIPADSYITRMQTYRIIANASPLWREGIHERVVLSMQTGALTLTDRSPLSDRAFAGLPTYAPFDWDDEAIHDAVTRALAYANEAETPDYEQIDKAFETHFLTDEAAIIAEWTAIASELRG